MSYIELRYHRSYVLEIREYGDTGWAVHIYPPSDALANTPLTVVNTIEISKLDAAVSRARRAIDTAFAHKAVREAECPDPVT